MFVDASAIVAIIAREADWQALAEKLGNAPAPVTSPIAVFEAALAIARIGNGDLARAQNLVEAFTTSQKIAMTAIDADVGREAITAHRRFGKTRHPARLNMGDCFAYACAKVHNVPLLCKGEDFAQTDIRIA